MRPASLLSLCLALSACHQDNAALEARLAALEAEVAALKGQTASLPVEQAGPGLPTKIQRFIEQTIAAQNLLSADKLAPVEDRVNANRMLLEEVQPFVQEAQRFFTVVQTDPLARSVTFRGVNVVIRNQEGFTDSETGTGNLILGFGEDVFLTGSHNVIVGTGHTVMGHGSIALGRDTTPGNFALWHGGGEVVVAAENVDIAGDRVAMGGTDLFLEGTTSATIDGLDVFVTGRDVSVDATNVDVTGSATLGLDGASVSATAGGVLDLNGSLITLN